MLEIINLKTSIDGKEILHGINMKVNRGEVIGLIGQNGSGKSTLFNSVLGLLKFSEGSVLIDNEKAEYSKSGKRDLRRKVTLVMQDPDRQIFYSTVRDELLFPLKNLKVPEDIAKKEIERVMKLLNMEYLEKRFVQNLSYGEKKRVTIGGAMLLKPKYLFLDEPTAGLDPRLVRQMKEILAGLKKETGLIVSSHDMDFIYAVCDYIYVIHSGEIVLKGTADEVYDNKELIYKAGLDIPGSYIIKKLKEKYNIEEEF